MNAGVLSNNAIPLAWINSANVNFSFADVSSQTSDRIAVGFVSLSYPRQFNFGGASNFAFTLPATSQGYYLEVTNFSGGASTSFI
jgi:hypothetical protein